MFQLSAIANRAYNTLSLDLGDLVHGWTTFRRLSLTDPETNRILNIANGHLWSVVQVALRTYSVAVLARMLDPPLSMRKANCSFAALLAEPTVATAPESAALTMKLTQLRVAARAILEFRNKRLAHNDHGVFVEDSPGAMFTFVEFDVVLRSLVELMHEFERAFKLRLVDYSSADGTGDVDRLFAQIRAAVCR